MPASLRLVWAEELEKWLPHLRPSSIHVIEGKSDRLQGSNLPAICITSYEMMQRLTCDACKGTGGNQVSLDKCAGSQVWEQQTANADVREPQDSMVCTCTGALLQLSTLISNMGTFLIFVTTISRHCFLASKG